MDYSPPGFSVHGILHAWILEWVAIPFSRWNSKPRDWTRVFCIAGRFFTIWATRLYCDSCHCSVQLKKKKKNLIKIGEFLCSHFRTEGGRKKQHFWHIIFYYFKKGKNATETQKDLCGIWRGCCDWLNVSQVVLEVSCWKFLSWWYCSPIGQLMLIEIKSRHWEQTTLYHKGGSQHTQNIQIKWWKSFAPTWLC